MTDKISNCCSAPVYDDSDICMACHEYCGVVEVIETGTEFDTVYIEEGSNNKESVIL